LRLSAHARPATPRRARISTRIPRTAANAGRLVAPAKHASTEVASWGAPRA
jgi:hypothetical protein